MWQDPQYLCHPLLLLPGNKQGAELEVEQLELKPIIYIFIWDASRAKWQLYLSTRPPFWGGWVSDWAVGSRPIEALLSSSPVLLQQVSSLQNRGEAPHISSGHRKPVPKSLKSQSTQLPRAFEKPSSLVILPSRTSFKYLFIKSII